MAVKEQLQYNPQDIRCLAFAQKFWGLNAQQTVEKLVQMYGAKIQNFSGEDLLITDLGEINGRRAFAINDEVLFSVPFWLGLIKKPFVQDDHTVQQASIPYFEAGNPRVIQITGRPANLIDQMPKLPSDLGRQAYA